MVSSTTVAVRFKFSVMAWEARIAAAIASRKGSEEESLSEGAIGFALFA